MSAATTEELVVLLDEQGEAIGTTPKRGVHHADTPLHLAFSCYLFDGAGRLLMTRRALHKPTWPGAWTNSVCGHPGPGEPIEDAVRRRVLDEVGLRAEGVRLMLPGFRYRAVMPNGVVENEMCPVFVATSSDEGAPNPDEVDDAHGTRVARVAAPQDARGFRPCACQQQGGERRSRPGPAAADPTRKERRAALTAIMASSLNRRSCLRL